MCVVKPVATPNLGQNVIPRVVVKPIDRKRSLHYLTL